MRSLARMMGLKMHWDAYRELDPRIDYRGVPASPGRAIIEVESG